MAPTELKSWNAKLRYKCNKESATDARGTHFYDHQLKFLGLLIDDDRRRALERCSTKRLCKSARVSAESCDRRNYFRDFACRNVGRRVDCMCDRVSKSGDRRCDQRFFSVVSSIWATELKVFQVYCNRWQFSTALLRVFLLKALIAKKLNINKLFAYGFLESRTRKQELSLQNITIRAPASTIPMKSLARRGNMSGGWPFIWNALKCYDTFLLFVLN